MRGVFCLAFFFESIAIAADIDDGGAMQEAVEGGGGHDGVAGENLAPIGEGFIAGQHDGLLLFVALADGLEQQAGVKRPP